MFKYHFQALNLLPVGTLLLCLKCRDVGKHIKLSSLITVFNGYTILLMWVLVVPLMFVKYGTV